MMLLEAAKPMLALETRSVANSRRTRQTWRDLSTAVNKAAEGFRQFAALVPPDRVDKMRLITIERNRRR